MRNENLHAAPFGRQRIKKIRGIPVQCRRVHVSILRAMPSSRCSWEFRCPRRYRAETGHDSAAVSPVQRWLTHLHDLYVAGGYGSIQGSLSFLVDNVQLGHPRNEDLQKLSSGCKNSESLFILLSS